MTLLFILSLVACSLIFAMYLTVKRDLKHLQDTFQLKILAKHVALTREIEALTEARKNGADFSTLDNILENIRKVHYGS
jgi:hypothetical protein